MWGPRYSLRTIRIAWVAIVFFLEVGIFIAASARCHWPDPGKGEATRVLLIADPQILDDRSYPERSAFLRAASRIFVDMNLRKAWRVAKSTYPHAVIFLGDMMDSGFAEMSMTEYDEYAGRFFSIFSAPRELPVYYIPGNHDVGLGNRRDASILARARYKVTFGLPSQHVYLGGHSLFLVDAPALVDEDLRREQAGENRTAGLPKDLVYLRHIRAQHQHAANAPLILLTHIPLFRSPESASCGPLREKGTLRAVRGLGYQTQYTPETSKLLFDELEPTLIFSGDDHDYCEYTHTVNDRRIPEVTVKSLSIAMGIRRPGFQLLSLSSESRTSAYEPCLLPDQLRVYCWMYVPLVLATVVLVAMRAMRSHHRTCCGEYALELPEYSALPQQPSSVPPPVRSYPLRLAEELWAIAYPPVAVYAIINIAVFL